MDFKERVKNFVNSLTGANRLEIKDEIEFRQNKIDLVKSEVLDIIGDIDSNNENQENKLEATDSQIEKGFLDGDSLKEHIESRYNKVHRTLILSLGNKKVELRKQESIMEDLLEKGSKARSYGDSIVRGASGDILMLLRKYSDTFEPGKWGLPGGKIEEGETAREGAIRELKEETNLTAISAYPCGVKKLADGGTISFFSVDVEEDQGWIGLDDEEHCNYIFMSIEELRRRPNSDFIKDARGTLLGILDPMYPHVDRIVKAHEEGDIGDDILKKAVNKYSGTFKFSKSKG